MSQTIARIVSSSFEDVNIITLSYRGKTCWLASQIAIAAGYSNPKHISSKIGADWANRFVRGEHFDKIEGDELSQLKQALQLVPDSETCQLVGNRANSVVILYEKGVNLALIKGDTDTCYRLQDWLASEVLPQVRRTGSYQAVPRPEDPDLIRAKAEDRQMRIDAIRWTVEALTGHLSEEALVSLKVSVAELALEKRLAFLRPFLEGQWSTPTELADGLGITPAAIGRIITKLGIRGDTRYSRMILDQKKHCGGQVKCYLYNEQAAQMIRSEARDAQNAAA